MSPISFSRKIRASNLKIKKILTSPRANPTWLGFFLSNAHGVYSWGRATRLLFSPFLVYLS